VEEKTKYDHKYYKVELTLIAQYPKQVYYVKASTIYLEKSHPKKVDMEQSSAYQLTPQHMHDTMQLELFNIYLHQEV
jgi:hypothetical protein